MKIPYGRHLLEFGVGNFRLRKVHLQSRKLCAAAVHDLAAEFDDRGHRLFVGFQFRRGHLWTRRLRAASGQNQCQQGQEISHRLLHLIGLLEMKAHDDEDSADSERRSWSAKVYFLIVTFSSGSGSIFASTPLRYLSKKDSVRRLTAGSVKAGPP